MKLNHHVLFLKQCKKEGVIPKIMYTKSSTNRNKNDKELKETMNKARNDVLQWR